MGVNFPPSPGPNQTIQGPNGTCWTWDGEKWIGGATGPWLSVWGGTMLGPLALDYTPASPLDAVNKQYVDNVFHDAFFNAPMDGQTYGLLLNNWTPVLPITGGLMRGPINMMEFRLTGIPDPVHDSDAVNKKWFEEHAGGIHYGPFPPHQLRPGVLWFTPQGNLFGWNGHYWIQLAGLGGEEGGAIPGIWDGGELWDGGDLWRNGNVGTWGTGTWDESGVVWG